jgi:hypothetical protein
VRVGLRHSFVLRPETVSTLWKSLHHRFSDVNATASCADSVERKFATAKSLLAYENTKAKRIVGLDLAVRSDDFKRTGHLRFSESVWGGGETIVLGLEGPELDMLRVKDEILEILDGIRPWYSLLSRIDFQYPVWGAAAVFYMLMVLRYGSAPSAPNPSIRLKDALLILFVVFGAFAGTIALPFWLNRLRRRVFPRATFSIGQGERRFELAEKFRWVVVVGLFVSVLAGLVTAYMLSFR